MIQITYAQLGAVITAAGIVGLAFGWRVGFRQGYLRAIAFANELLVIRRNLGHALDGLPPEEAEIAQTIFKRATGPIDSPF